MLPIADGPPERADAARNRRKILAAAAEVMADKGVAGLSLDEVARVAGVGVGTVYRRFADRSGLVRALLDHTERDFQRSFMAGPPPLGPGAPAPDRIRAFLHAMVDRLERDHELLIVTEQGQSAFVWGGPYVLLRTHLTLLLREARPDANAAYLADALLAPLSARLYVHQRFTLGYSVETVKAGLDDLIRWT